MRRDRTKLYSGEPGRDPSSKQFAEIQPLPQRWDRRHVNIVVSFGIIAIVMGLFWYSLRNLPQRLQETGCLTRLHQIGQVLTMYSTDYERDPPVDQFPMALYPYLQGADTLPEGKGREDEEMQQITGWRQTVPPEARKLFVCPADRREQAQNSYLLVDPRRFPRQALQLSESIQPWVVDEIFHRHNAIILYRDGHTEPLDKEVYLRSTRPLFNIHQPGE